MSQNLDSSDECLISGSNDPNISIPYFGKISEELRIGSYVKIFGKTDSNAIRFAVNLMTDSEDIALHFNPRLRDGFVVRNTRIGDIFCNEERQPLEMPFERDQYFSLLFSVEEECYRIFVNAIHFINFRHRLPFSTITSIAIDGDLQVQAIQFDHNDYDQSLDSLSCFMASTVLPEQKPVIKNIFNPKLPFCHEIPNGLRVGMVLTVIGRPLSNDHKFDINLVQKQSFGLNSDIALHISVRFGKTSDDSKVIRNYRIGSEWGPEEKYCAEFPFKAEKIFDMRIIVETNRFIIIINGKTFTEFPNRLYPLSYTNQMEINGNLELFSVRI